MTLMPLWYKGLTPELRRKAEEELGETSDVKAKALVDLRRLINEQENLYSRLDEVFLLRFLRHKNYDVRQAFRILNNYYTLGYKHRGTLTGRKPSEFRHVIDMNCILYLPQRLSSGSHVAIYRYGSYDIQRSKADDLLAITILIGEMILECEATQISGGVIVMDLADMNMHHYKNLVTVNILSLAINFVQDCIPERFKAFHIVHEPRLIYGMYRIVKPLLKKKTRERLHFHGNDLESLHAYIPRDMLPEELGGNAGPYDYQEFASYFFNQEDFIERIKKYGFLDKT